MTPRELKLDNMLYDERRHLRLLRAKRDSINMQIELAVKNINAIRKEIDGTALARREDS